MHQPPAELRLPRAAATAATDSANPPPSSPSLEWLTAGTWYATHSTLPTWRDVRNLELHYTLLPSSSSALPQIEDLVTYQNLTSDKVKTIRGVNTVSSPDDTGEFDWRGKGWLKIVSSHWEILGWGDDHDEATQWMVTFFSKTIFTPAGIDIVCRRKAGLSAKVVNEIKEALSRMDHDQIKTLGEQLFELPKQ